MRERVGGWGTESFANRVLGRCLWSVLYKCVCVYVCCVCVRVCVCACVLVCVRACCAFLRVRAA